MLMVVTSISPDNYFYYRHDAQRDWSYPTTGVVIACLAVLGETTVAATVLRTSLSGRFWKRGLVALVLLALWAMPATAFVVHAPVFLLIHHAWLLLLLAFLGIGVAFSGLIALTTALRLRLSSHI